MAGPAPIPSSGIMNTSRASEGMVWITPAAARIACPTLACRQASTPRGIARAMAAASETATRKRCSAVRPATRRSAPRDAPDEATPSLARRKSEATCASGTRSIRARAFIAIISRAEMAPSRRASAPAAGAHPEPVERARKIALASEQLLHDRSGVLGINVDLAGAERLPEHAGATQLATVVRFHARRPQRLHRDLREDHRFGELLRPD